MLALLLWLAVPAGAATGAEECVAIEGVGCAYLPVNVAAPALLVYLRGHLEPYGGAVPPAQRVASARQAFDFYGLRALARKEGLAVLVTGSSDVAVTEEGVAALERRAGAAFRTLYVASHSGGNVGLAGTLGRVRRPERIVMLDNFYFGEALSRKVQEQVAAGSVCAGFYTAHNLKRYEKHFKPFVYCPVEAHDDYGHTGGVVRCLGRYLSSMRCD